MSADTTSQKAHSTGVIQEGVSENQDDVQEVNSTKTAREFYAEITQREDVRVILEALARN